MVVRKDDLCPLTEDGTVCGAPVFARGWCGKHYARFMAHGDPLHPVRRYVRQPETCTYPDGCEEPSHALGLCKTHYRRQVVHGETTDPRERRFWAKVDRNGPVPEHRPDLGPCWLWTGYIDPKSGYGQFGGKGNGTNLPHRIAYQYTRGPIGKGLHLDHLCRVRRCVRPEHLDPVTPRENIRRGDQGAFWGYEPEVIPVAPVQLTLAICANGCAKPPHKRGICRPCYRRWLKDPDAERPSQRTPEQRFWAKVEKTGSCWLWTGSINAGNGYGQFSPRHGYQVMAHRYSYELAKGQIPEKLDIHHTCHVRRCVNPSHLQAVARSENMRLRKNRRAA